MASCTMNGLHNVFLHDYPIHIWIAGTYSVPCCSISVYQVRTHSSCAHCANISRKEVSPQNMCIYYIVAADIPIGRTQHPPLQIHPSRALPQRPSSTSEGQQAPPQRPPPQGERRQGHLRDYNSVGSPPNLDGYIAHHGGGGGCLIRSNQQLQEQAKGYQCPNGDVDTRGGMSIRHAD